MLYIMVACNSPVSTVTGLWAAWFAVQYLAGVLGPTHSPIQPVPGLFPRKCDGDHSFPLLLHGIYKDKFATYTLFDDREYDIYMYGKSDTL
jgi:hypothetical protein